MGMDWRVLGQSLWPWHMVSGEEVVVIVGLMLFGEMKLPLYLRGDGEFFGGHQKKGRTIVETTRARK